MELHEMIEKVDSKESFLQFVAALRADWETSQAEERLHRSSPYSAAARGWENTSLGPFLEAMQAWAEDTGERVPSQASWRTFAQLLLAAKSYE